MSSLELNPDEYPWKIESRVVGYGTVDPTEHISLDYEKHCEADYSGRKLKHFGAVGCRFERCGFENMRIDSFAFGSGHHQSEYIDCKFDGTRVYTMLGGFARFVRCSFRNVDIRKWKWCEQTELIDCVFTGRLEECIFCGTVPEKDRSWVGREQNEFRGNDFSGCDLIDVSFRTGIDLSQQKLPTGPMYLYLPDAAAAVARARAAVSEWYDLGMRNQGLSLLKSIELESQGGQRQLLLRADDYETRAPELVDGVFVALGRQA
jgi:hypothetical protein